MSNPTATSHVMPLPAESYRWIILLICSLCFFMSFINRLAWSNVSLGVGGEFNIPFSVLGIFTTSFYIGYVLFNALGGLLSDRVGAKATLVGSMILLGILTSVFGFTHSLPQGLTIMFLMGLAAGADYACCLKLIVVWFDRSLRGRAVGLFMIASSLSVAVSNLVIPALADWVGWRNVYHVLGGITLAIGMLSFLLIRETPESASVPATRVTWATLKPLLRKRNLWLLTVAGFGGFWGTWGFAFWSSSLLVKHEGFTASEAGYIVSLAGLAAIVGKPVFGYVADRTGSPKWIAVGSLVLFAVMLLVFGNLQGRTAYLVAAPLLGLGAFVYSPLLGLMVAEVAGAERAGSATGLTAAIWQLGSAIVSVAVGAVFQVTHSFDAAFMVLAAGPALAVVALIRLKL